MKKKYAKNRIYKVIGYEKEVDSKVLRRLIEFGFSRGTKFVLSHKSLFGKSVIVELRGYSLSIRKKSLELLKVE